MERHKNNITRTSHNTEYYHTVLQRTYLPPLMLFSRLISYIICMGMVEQYCANYVLQVLYIVPCHKRYFFFH